LNEIENPKNIFEIGLGTNNSDVVSTMGSNGRPGASLKAFKEYLPHANIYGGDYDKRILFNEKRIKTFFIDQTNPTTFDDLDKVLSKDFDLMIDDGLHAPNANLNSLKFFLNHIRVGGFAVIEDVNQDSEALWKIVSFLIEPCFESALIKTKTSSMFIVERVG